MAPGDMAQVPCQPWHARNSLPFPILGTSDPPQPLSGRRALDVHFSCTRSATRLRNGDAEACVLSKDTLGDAMAQRMLVGRWRDAQLMNVLSVELDDTLSRA